MNRLLLSRCTGTPAAVLAAIVLLAGCTPAHWPTREDAPPVATPPARVPATTQRQAPAPTTGKATAAPGAPAPRTGNPPFYEVFGERYFVLPSSDGYREQGMASWYGEPFHGRRTSSGVVFDMYELTAAHKTLPLPSLVRVTNLDSGRSIVVTVNDRGPFVKDRIIDLSFAAAEQLGIVQAGTGRVEVVAVGDRAAAATGRTPGEVQLLFMQVGAFREEGNAVDFKARLESNGVNGVAIRYDDDVSPALYRVRIGPIAGPAEYDALASRMASLDIVSPRLVMESPDPRGSTPTP